MQNSMTFSLTLKKNKISLTFHCHPEMYLKEEPIIFLPVHLFCLFCCFTSQVNSYGHGGTVSSPNHTFFLGKLEQAVNQYFVHILLLVTDNNPS